MNASILHPIYIQTTFTLLGNPTPFNLFSTLKQSPTSEYTSTITKYNNTTNSYPQVTQSYP